jgi:hypothetical protein
MPGPRDKRHRTRRSALLKRTTGIPIRHRGGRKPGDARFSCGTASRIDRPLNHHGRCRTNLKRRQAHNVRDQRLAETAFLNRPACSRVRCIAVFAAGPTRGSDPPSRRTRVYQCQGLARQRGSPASRGSEPNRRAQRGYTPRSGPRMTASSASTPHQPLRSLREGSPSAPSPHDAAPPPSLSETRHQLRLLDWATMRPSFTLRRFT